MYIIYLGIIVMVYFLKISIDYNWLKVRFKPSVQMIVSWLIKHDNLKNMSIVIIFLLFWNKRYIGIYILRMVVLI